MFCIFSFKLCEREKGVEKEDVYTQVIFNTRVVQALPPPDKSWGKKSPGKSFQAHCIIHLNIFVVRIGACLPILLHFVVHPLQTSRTPIPIGLKPGPLTWNSHLPRLLLLPLYPVL